MSTTRAVSRLRSMEFKNNLLITAESGLLYSGTGNWPTKLVPGLRMETRSGKGNPGRARVTLTKGLTGKAFEVEGSGPRGCLSEQESGRAVDGRHEQERLCDAFYRKCKNRQQKSVGTKIGQRAGHAPRLDLVVVTQARASPKIDPDAHRPEATPRLLCTLTRPH